MPITLPDGSEWPTPEETVAALIEQGCSAAEIIAEAETNIAEAEAGIVWVDAVAAGEAGRPDNARRILAEAVEHLSGKQDGTTEYRDALDAIGEANTRVQVSAVNALAANEAAVQHRRHANETISNAERRIAAAKTVKK